MISVEDVSSLKKGGFSRKEKHIELNAMIKLFNQTSKHHFKLSKTQLKQDAKHIDPNTHTHTHTHTHTQTSLTNFIF